MESLPQRTADVVVIGGGPGGYPAAIRAAQLGLRVLLIEADKLGGICLNAGCIPSKALISAAGFYHSLHRQRDRGILVEGATVDFARMQAWKAGVVSRLTSGVELLCRSNGVEVMAGRAAFRGPHELVVYGDDPSTPSATVRFSHCIIATGSRPAPLEGFPFDGRRILDSTAALGLEAIPPSMTVIGGGYIGLELGTAYAKLGSAVAVVEVADQLLPAVDPELAQVVTARLRRLGVTTYLSSRVVDIQETGDSLALTIEGPEGSVTHPSSVVLVSVGRVPNTEALDLDRAGVVLDARGFIQTNERMQTSQPHIYAVGDVAGPPLLAHKATHEGIVAAEAIAGKPAARDWIAMPAVIFTDPEVASVGLTEAEATARGFRVKCGKFPFTASGSALAMDSGDGFVKVVADAGDGSILGVHIIGPQASTMIAEAVVAMEMGATVEDLTLMVHAHPTLPEAIMEAAAVVAGTPIHLPRSRS